ncbi:MAG: hypothetical protein JNK23_15260 [Opitutaceae bacterium]|nr:hypothetical protein [Opitutaceae bacterium]
MRAGTDVTPPTGKSRLSRGGLRQAPRFALNFPGAVAVFLVTLAATHAAEFKFPTQTLRVPEGFTIELVAGPPAVNRPISVAFDPQGRLYATDSSGLSDRAPEQQKLKPHRIVRLEDKNGDGRYETSVVFAENMMFPQGALFHDGSLFVAAPPQIWKLTDTDGDGRSDRREVWWDGGTLTGCANDVHGPYLGPDGWFYWTKGAFAEQKHTLGDGTAFTSRAAHIYRARPDGSRLEPIMTGGMDNPVGVAFTPTGDRILSGTFFITPAAGLRDGLIHALYGGVYGKENAASAGHPRTGDLMPLMTHMGAAAPCGSVAYRSAGFGRDFTGNHFVCYFNLRKVSRHVLVPDGASFKTIDSDFVTSDSPDFHPTDVLEDADGSLLVVDTGGWYKICCPTSQLSKPEVLGGIYRVRKNGAPRTPAPPAGPLADLWAHALTDTPAARAAVRARLTDKDPATVQVALHLTSLWRDTYAFDQAVRLLSSDDLATARLAAETLGRVRDPRAIGPLLEVAARLDKAERTPTGTPAANSDRALEHALTYALIEIGRIDEVRRGLKAAPAIARIALVALDQMPGGDLQPGDVLPSLNSSHPILRDTAGWIVSHRPAWGDALAQHFRDRLSGSSVDGLAAQLAPLAGSPAIQQLLADTLATPNRTVALAAMRAAGLKETPASWFAALTRLLNTAARREALAAARALPQPKGGHATLATALGGLGADTTVDASTRLEALALATQSLRSIDDGTLAFLLAHLDARQAAPSRASAAAALGAARLTPPQTLRLARAMSSVGPLDAPKLLPALERMPNDESGLALINALRDSRALAGLRAAQLRQLFGRYPAAVQAAAAPLLAAVSAGVAEQNHRIDALLPTVTAGNISRGHLVFNSEKTACRVCHKIGYGGGLLGPDLTTIGRIRSERELLEAIVFPSATLVRGYESVTVTTKSGDTHTGIIRRDDAEEVTLATGPESTQRIARGDIADVQPSPVSPMPPGMDAVLTPQELADLVAFLKARQ